MHIGLTTQRLHDSPRNIWLPSIACGQRRRNGRFVGRALFRQDDARIDHKIWTEKPIVQGEMRNGRI